MLAPDALSRTAKDISSSAAGIAVLQVSLSVAHQSSPARTHLAAQYQADDRVPETANAFGEISGLFDGHLGH